MNVFERERSSIDAHRKAMQGSSLPPPGRLVAGNFLHGFFLPFSLIVATLRDAQLRAPYLRVTLVRLAVLMVGGGMLIANGCISTSRKSVTADEDDASQVDADGADGAEVDALDAARHVHVKLPGLRVDVDEDKDHDNADVSLLGRTIAHHSKGKRTEPHDTKEAEVATAKPGEAPKTVAGRAWAAMRASWKWLLTLFAFLSAIEGIIVLFSRRWDDWLSFHASRLAKIRPEEGTPRTPKLALDLKWLYRKARRRFRGYVVFSAGLPVLLPLRLIPTAGSWMFTVAATLWGWYWLGVFTAAKSAHAWADESTALSPLAIRTLNARVASGRLVWPLRVYGQAWARLTRSVNPAAATFELSPRAFLGLALARALLALPGLYFLARPIVPVAAGRLCAEGDRLGRFSLTTSAPGPR